MFSSRKIHRICSVCGKRFSVSNEYRNYFLEGFSWFCSTDCLYDAIIYISDTSESLKLRKSSLDSSPSACYIDGLDMCFRSKFEGLFALWATYREFASWYYECVAIPYKADRWYNPDFIINGKVMIETKGKWSGAGKKKIIQAKNDGYDIILVPYYMEPMLKKDVAKMRRKEMINEIS